jgi:hypothetical protein
MVAWVVIDRRHDRQSLKSRLPRALGAKGPTPGLHLSGAQIEAPPQLWSGDPDMVGFGPSDLPTFPFWNSPPYPLSPLLSCTYVEPILQPFCFQVHAWNGGVPLRRSDLHTFLRVSDLSPFFSHSCALFCTQQKLNPFIFNRFRTLCRKPPGVGVPPCFPPFPIALSHFALPSGLAHSQGRPEHQ